MSYTISYPSAPAAPAAGARGYLFVLGHMRSFSSLLAHILGSNPEICGYAELHRSYLGRNDLRRLERAVEDATGTPLAGRIALDKILHDNCEIADGILQRPEVRVVFLLREPAATLASIARMAAGLEARDWYAEPRLAHDYYCRRLDTLGRYARSIGDRAAYVASERLIADPDAVLGHLTEWLRLAQPLSREYRTFRLTGVTGHGDPSAAIRSGRLDPGLADGPAATVATPTPEEMLARARAAWAACRDVFAARCAAL